MANIIKLRKGLTLNLKGQSWQRKVSIPPGGVYGLKPSDFPGLTPKVAVKEGDHVLVGDALFVNKAFPEVGFTSPVSGTVVAVKRGERRKVLCVKVKADDVQVFHDFGQADVDQLSADDVKRRLEEAGLFGYINQLPYAISTTPDTTPKAIFVSAFRDMPLACDFSFELKGNEEAFKTGLTALSRIAPVNLGINPKMDGKFEVKSPRFNVTVFDGPCPAGNVGVQVNHISPVNKGETVWTVDPTAVIFFGRLFLTGKVNLTRTIAIAGSQIKQPMYADVLVGTPLSRILEGRLAAKEHVRITNGNPLTGYADNLEGFLGAHTSEVTAIPEGDNADEMLGWILPRTNQFSVNHSYFSWLLGKHRTYDLDARIKGGERHMIMSGEYDRVLPMDILGEYLIKAIISGDIDRQEQLGIYEVAPEDFALAEFVDSSKMPLQQIVRQGLDTLRKENA